MNESYYENTDGATYYGTNGATYKIAAELNNGGEGKVCYISSNPDLVCKVYKPTKLNSELRRKINFMLELHSEFTDKNLSSLAWPIDLARNEKGDFIGFVMKKVTGDSIRKCYTANDFSVTYRQRIWIAINLCALVDSVHTSIKQVIGDFNPDNILVDKNTGVVSLVDTDSFHLKTKNGIVFRCGVLQGQYLAPELQGVDLKTTYSETYTPETDRFSLAIHIFCLLMNGTHPFASRKAPISTSVGKNSVAFPAIESLIKNGQSPHFSRKRDDLLPPIYCPDISILPVNLQRLFRRAFDEGYSDPSVRPSAIEWYNELKAIERPIACCPKDSSHFYDFHVKKCPWCEIKELETQNTKPSSSSSSAHRKSFQSSAYNSSHLNNSTVSNGPKKAAPSNMPPSVKPSSSSSSAHRKSFQSSAYNSSHLNNSTVSNGPKKAAPSNMPPSVKPSSSSSSAHRKSFQSSAYNSSHLNNSTVSNGPRTNISKNDDGYKTFSFIVYVAAAVLSFALLSLKSTIYVDINQSAAVLIVAGFISGLITLRSLYKRCLRKNFVDNTQSTGVIFGKIMLIIAVSVIISSMFFYFAVSEIKPQDIWNMVRAYSAYVK